MASACKTSPVSVREATLVDLVLSSSSVASEQCQVPLGSWPGGLRSLPPGKRPLKQLLNTNQRDLWFLKQT